VLANYEKNGKPLPIKHWDDPGLKGFLKGVMFEPSDDDEDDFGYP
jgi:hypothetical protein